MSASYAAETSPVAIAPGSDKTGSGSVGGVGASNAGVSASDASVSASNAAERGPVAIARGSARTVSDSNAIARGSYEIGSVSDGNSLKGKSGNK